MVLPPNITRTSNLCPGSKVRGSVEGKLLRGIIKGRGILAKSRLKTYSLNMEYEELDQISRIGG